MLLLLFSEQLHWAITTNDAAEFLSAVMMKYELGFFASAAATVFLCCETFFSRQE